MTGIRRRNYNTGNELYYKEYFLLVRHVDLLALIY